MLTEEQAQQAIEIILLEGTVVDDGRVKSVAPTLLGATIGGLRAGGWGYLEILRNIATIVQIIKEYGPEIVATVTDLYEQARRIIDKIKEILGK